MAAENETNTQAGASTETTPAGDKVLFGLENVTIFPKIGENAWGDPIRIPGAINLALNPSGSTNALFADNKKYFNSIANTGWEGDLEMVMFPDEFYIAALGWKHDDRGGLVEVSDAVPKPFALAFEVSGDIQKRRVVFFECTATRPASEAKTTEDTTTPQTQKSTVTAVPVKFPKVTTARYVLPASTDDKTSFEGFYESVVMPKFEAEAAA